MLVCEVRDSVVLSCNAYAAIQGQSYDPQLLLSVQF